MLPAGVRQASSMRPRRPPSPLHLSEAEFSRQAAVWLHLHTSSGFKRRQGALAETPDAATYLPAPARARAPPPLCRSWPAWKIVRRHAHPPILELDDEVFLVCRRAEMPAAPPSLRPLLQPPPPSLEPAAAADDDDDFLADCELATVHATPSIITSALLRVPPSPDVDSSSSPPAHATGSPPMPAAPLPPFLRARFQIIYDRVYRVPALCFDAWDEQGVAVSHDVLACYMLHDVLPHAATTTGSMSRLRSDADALVTQIEHPYTERPVFQIHPCRTAAIMGTLFKSASALPLGGYLLAWFNVYGREAGLAMEPGNYARAVAFLSASSQNDVSPEKNTQTAR